MDDVLEFLGEFFGEILLELYTELILFIVPDKPKNKLVKVFAIIIAFIIPLGSAALIIGGAIMLEKSLWGIALIVGGSVICVGHIVAGLVLYKKRAKKESVGSVDTAADGEKESGGSGDTAADGEKESSGSVDDVADGEKEGGAD